MQDVAIKQELSKKLVVKFIFKKILNAGLFFLRFNLFLLNLALNFASDLIEKLILNKWTWFIKRRNRQREQMYEIEVVTNGTRHEYVMSRGKEYDRLYKDLKSNVDVTERGTTIILDQDLSKDIIAKIDRIIYLVERNAIKEGYRFGKAAKEHIEEDDVYSEYIIEQVKKGR